MNRHYLLTLVALGAVIGTAVLFYPRAEEPAPVVSATPKSVPDNAVRLDPASIDPVTGPQWEVSDNGGDGELPNKLIPLAQALGISEDDLEEVDGITVYKDRDCKVNIVKYVYREDGSLAPVYECKPNTPKTKDPYTTYSAEALETMAYSDPKAAYVLSGRAMSRQNYPRALEYGLRSAALSNEPRPMYQLMMGNLETRTTPQAHRDSLKRRYVLSGIAEALDMDSPFHDKVIRSIAGLQGEPIDVAALDREIEAHLQTIEAVRAEVGID